MTVRLKRQYPEHIPAIHPLPEFAVSGTRKEWYEDMKQVLQVPWMGVVTMAYSHYPNFFETLWNGLRPICQSKEFISACFDLRQHVESATETLSPKNIIQDLQSLGYGTREIQEIRDMNTIFSHGNQSYVIISTITRYLMEIGDISRNRIHTPNTDRHGPVFTTPFLLMEAHHVDQPTYEIYEDIKKVIGLPFVNTDYRAFARWPTYWALAWKDLRQSIPAADHESVCLSCHELATEFATSLPNPGKLVSEQLVEAAQADGSLDEVRQMCQLFQWLLPGLITNVAYLRHQLTE